MMSVKIVFVLLVTFFCHCYSSTPYYSYFGCQPSQVAYGSYSPIKSSYYFGDVITFKCLPGYSLHGPSKVKCGYFRWAAKFPTCVKIVSCEKPGDVDNGSFKPIKPKYFPGQKIWFDCDPGHKLNGYKDLVCQKNGEWNRDFPTCDPIQCDAPDKPNKGFFKPSKDVYNVGDKVWFGCRRGYELDGTKDLVCRKDGNFFPDEPTCVPKSCPNPDDVDNASFGPKKKVYYVGDKVWYRCDVGYELDGQKDLKCLRSGKWNADFPICVEIECDAPDKPDNGFFREKKDSYVVGKKVWFGCRKGYKLKGAKDLECLRGGRWSDDEPTCERICCPKPDDVDNALFRPKKKVYCAGDKVWYGCDVGYELNGKKDLQCLRNGKWNDDFPICVGKQCDAPDKPDYGFFSPSKNAYDVGDKVWFGCRRGFVLKGTKDLVCRKDGKFFPEEPICVRACPVPNKVAYGSFGPVQNYYIVGAKIWFRCNAGYVLQGTKDLVCEDDGNWSSKIPTCVRKQCDAPDRPDYGFFSPSKDSYDVGDKVWFGCRRGFVLKGTKDLVCRKDGKFFPDEPTCVGTCPVPKKVAYGSFGPVEKLYAVGAKIWFRCNAGYVLKGTKDLVCEDDGNWSSKIPTCVRTCPVPKKVAYGSFGPVQNYYGAGAKIWFRCNAGYVLKGTKDLVCEDDGNWSSKIPTCVRKQCDAPDRPNYGFFSPSKNAYDVGDKVWFGCRRGFVLKGTKDLVCGKDGKFFPDEPTCVGACPVPNKVAYGSFGPVQNYYIVGAKIWFRCNAGYVLQGTKDLVCEDDGNWSSKIPTCVRTCPVPKKVAYGSFGPVQKYYGAGAKIWFKCNAGYVLKGTKDLVCEEDGNWSSKIPTCVRKQCDAPDRPDYGFFSPSKDSYDVGDKVWFGCRRGFVLKGTKDLVCRKDGKFFPDEPTCVGTCPVPKKVAYGSFGPVEKLYAVGAKIWFRCNAGYVLKGTKDLVCEDDGNWSSKIPTCVRTCPVPKKVAYGSFGPVQNYYGAGAKIWFKCNAGYVLKGTKDLVCEDDGNWSSKIPTCVRKQCDAPDRPDYGFFSPSKNAYDVGDKVWFGCRRGFVLKGTKDLVCRKDGKFFPDEPTCVGTCLVPNKVAYGSFGPVRKYYGVGAKIWFKCNAGYALQGTKDLVCKSNGNWSSKIPTCKRKGSCRGRCNSYSPYGFFSSYRGGCQCNSGCIYRGNCCDDYKHYCVLRH